MLNRNMCRPLEDDGSANMKTTKRTTPSKTNSSGNPETSSPPGSSIRSRSDSLDSSSAAKFDKSGNRIFTPQNRRLPYNNQDLEALYKMNGKRSKALDEWSFNKIRASYANDEIGKPIQGAVRVRPFSIGERQQAARRVVSVNRNGDKLVLVNPNAQEDDCAFYSQRSDVS